MPQQWDAYPLAAKCCQLDGQALLLFFTRGSAVNEFLNNLLSQYRDRVTVAAFVKSGIFFATPFASWGVSGTQCFDAHNNPPAISNHSAAASQRSCPLSEDRPFTPSFWKILCRCSFTVPLLSPSSRATCLLDKPRATRHATSRSRRVNIRTDNLLVPWQTRDQPMRLRMSELSGCGSNSHAKQWLHTSTSVRH
jgi:hypothetical protein